jgi:hypothetical protein
VLLIACANEFPRALTELPESAHVKLRVGLSLLSG